MDSDGHNTPSDPAAAVGRRKVTGLALDLGAGWESSHAPPASPMTVPTTRSNGNGSATAAARYFDISVNDVSTPVALLSPAAHTRPRPRPFTPSSTAAVPFANLPWHVQQQQVSASKTGHLSGMADAARASTPTRPRSRGRTRVAPLRTRHVPTPSPLRSGARGHGAGGGSAPPEGQQPNAAAASEAGAPESQPAVPELDGSGSDGTSPDAAPSRKQLPALSSTGLPSSGVTRSRSGTLASARSSQSIESGVSTTQRRHGGPTRVPWRAMPDQLLAETLMTLVSTTSQPPDDSSSGEAVDGQGEAPSARAGGVMRHDTRRHNEQHLQSVGQSVAASASLGQPPSLQFPSTLNAASAGLPSVDGALPPRGPTPGKRLGDGHVRDMPSWWAQVPQVEVAVDGGAGAGPATAQRPGSPALFGGEPSRASLPTLHQTSGLADASYDAGPRPSGELSTSIGGPSLAYNLSSRRLPSEGSQQKLATGPTVQLVAGSAALGSTDVSRGPEWLARSTVVDTGAGAQAPESEPARHTRRGRSTRRRRRRGKRGGVKGGRQARPGSAGHGSVVTTQSGGTAGASTTASGGTKAKPPAEAVLYVPCVPACPRHLCLCTTCPHKPFGTPPAPPPTACKQLCPTARRPRC